MRNQAAGAQPHTLALHSGVIERSTARLAGPPSSSQYSSNASFATHGLRGEDVIRATNGPAYYTFAALVPPAFVALPPHFDNTPQPTKNILRAHVALLYFCDRERERFIEKAYPKIAQTRKSRAALTPEK